MQDKIILGFLMLKDLSVYEIKNAMEKSISHFYSTSYGSIHPALLKLEKLDLVSYTMKKTGNRDKKVYSITEKGKTTFNDWLLEDIKISRMKENSLVKLFFFGKIDKSNRQRIIRNYINDINKSLDELKSILDETENREIPDDFKEIANFQIETLLFGIDNAKFISRWYTNLLKKRI